MTTLRARTIILLIAVIGMFAGLAATWVGWFAPLVSLAAVAYIAPLVAHIRHAREPGGLLRPGLWASVAYIVYFGLGGLQLMLHDPTRHADHWLLLLAGYGGLQAGLAVFKEEEPRPLAGGAAADWPRRRFRWLMALWLVTGLAACAGYFLLMGASPWMADNPEDARLGVAGGGAWRVAIYSLIVWCFFAWADRRTARHLPLVLTAIGSAAIAAVFVLLGNRAPLVALAAMAILIGVAFAGKAVHLDRRTVLRGAALAAAVGLAFGLFGAFRVASDARVSRYPEIQTYLEDNRYLGLAVSQTMRYMGQGAEHFATVVEAVPAHYGHRWGLSYLDPLLTALPGRQDTLDIQLKQAFDMHFAGSGFVPSMPGEGYVNFGIAGVVFAPFAIGAALAYTHRRWRRTNGVGDGLLYLFCLYYLTAHMISGVLASSIFPLEAAALIVIGDRVLRFGNRTGESV